MAERAHIQHDDVHLPFFLLNFYLISILVKEVEDSGQIVLHLARAEQVEENQHVCHCWGEESFVSYFVRFFSLFVCLLIAGEEQEKENQHACHQKFKMSNLRIFVVGRH